MSYSDIPSYRTLIDQASELLSESSDYPRIDAEVLLQHATQESMAWLIARGDQLASSDHIRTYFELVEKRQKGEPVAYIVGHRDFWTLSLNVDERVLIPRPDTETLVEQALERLPKNSAPNLLDLGTGSGAIALALAKERPYAHMLAVDSQAPALELAEQNAKTNGVINVDFKQSNWFESVSDQPRFDLIASNPPYVEADDPHLQCGDLRFEPDTALIAQDKGLADLRQIVASAPHYLKTNGWLLLEHGYNQAEAVRELLIAAGFFNIELHKDINDLPRCTSAQHAGPQEA